MRVDAQVACGKVNLLGKAGKLLGMVCGAPPA